jgi:hypothetical protein
MAAGVMLPSGIKRAQLILWWLLHYGYARPSAHAQSIAKHLLQVQHLLALEYEFGAEPVDLLPRFLR